jgi:hypothetical protein
MPREITANLLRNQLKRVSEFSIFVPKLADAPITARHQANAKFPLEDAAYTYSKSHSTAQKNHVS